MPFRGQNQLENSLMTPHAFGYKIAVEMRPTTSPSTPAASAMTPFGQKTDQNPSGYDIKTDEQARFYRDRGNFAGNNKTYAAQPKPIQPYTPPAPNPENQRVLGNFRTAYPQFPDGVHRDMLQLHVQNDGAGLATFLRNSLRQYPQQNSQPPAR